MTAFYIALAVLGAGMAAFADEISDDYESADVTRIVGITVMLAALVVACLRSMAVRVVTSA